MKLRTIVALALLALTAAGLAGLAVAAPGGRSALADAANATARFHDLDVAKAAGYQEFHDAKDVACIELAGTGAMGVHYVKGSLVGDTVLDPTQPEALVYEPRADRKLDLVAVEYIVFQEAWQAENLKPPTLFGREFDLVPAGNRYGLPPFYALHAWLWKPNPSGDLEAWNPRVTC